MKKHGFRSIFSLLLAVMMVCSMLPTAAFAEGDVEEQPVVVETYTVTYADGMGGAAFPEQKKEGLLYGDPTPAFAGEPALDGYTFTGWDQEIAGTVTQSVTYTAQWQKVQQEAQSDVQQEADGNGETDMQNGPDGRPLLNPDGGYGAENGNVVYKVGPQAAGTITIEVRVFDGKQGYLVGYDTAKKANRGVQSEAYVIPELTKFVESGKFGKVTGVYGSWYWPHTTNLAVGTTIYWSNNSSTGTMTYYVDWYNPNGGGDNPTPPTHYLWNFTLHYDANGGTGAPADQTYGSNDKYYKSHTFDIPSTVPIREGYTFKGWSDTKGGSATRQPGGTCLVGQTVSGYNGGSVTKTLYAVWEKKAPNGPTNGEVTNLLGQVKVHCTTLIAGHEDQTYGLHYALSFMDMLPDGSGYTCNVRVEADEYVTKYNGNYPGTDHVLADGEKRIRSFVLRNDNDGKGWYISEGENLLPIVFNVKCEAPTPPTIPTDKEIERALSGKVNVVVSCVTENSGHPSKTYPLFAYVSGLTKPNPNEVTANSDGTYSYTVSFLASNFVKMYSGAAPFGIGSDHELADAQDLRTVTLTLRDITVGWTATTQDIKVSAKCEEQQPEETYTVTYTDGVEDEEVFKDEVYPNLKADDPTPKFNNGVDPTRDGFTFQGWEPEVAQNVTGNATYTAKWKKDSAPPTEGAVMAALKGAVKITCTTPNSGHDPKVYDLMSGFTPGTVHSDASTGYTYTISVDAGSYVYQYNAVMGGTGVVHTLDDTSPKPITLRWDGRAWVAETELPINFNVKCETENPPVDIRKPTFDELKDLLEVKIECTNESAAHELKFERYALKNVDEDSKFAIGDVDQSGDVPTCTVTIGSKPYVAAFDGTTGKAHEEADTTQMVDLVYNKKTREWALKNADDATVVFQVACTTEEPEGPGDITDEDLKKLSVVINCTNEAAEHEYKNRSYTLDRATCEFDYREEGYACEITVPAAPYVNKYTSDTKTNHELVDPQESSKTITLRWNTETKAWAADSNSVTFDVKCETAPVIPELDLSMLQVIIDCDKDEHQNESFDLLTGTYTKTPGQTANSYIIEISADGYVDKYNDLVAPGHQLVDPATSPKTITATWNGVKWNFDATSVTFDVKCKPDAPKAEDLLSVVIHCKSDVHNDGLYDLKDGNFTVGEVEGNEADGYTCKVTVEAAQYVNKYVGEMKVNHDIVGEGTKTVTLRYESALERWIVDSTVVTFDVECIPAPNISMLQVQVHCVTPNSSHMDESYDLPEDTTLEYVDANTRKITVQAAPYVEQYGNGHELADGESESKTITATWDGVKWNFDATSVTFNVKCTTQEGPAAPTAEQVASLLKVKVSCANSSAAHQENMPAFVYQPLLPRSFGIGGVTGSAESGYACQITVRAALYVQDFNTRSNATHTPTDGEEKPVTLYYEDGGWTVGTGSGLVEFTVICENVPAQKYTVTYTDGVDGVEIFKDQVYADLTAGTATPKFNGTPTRVGYFFAGWNPAVTATVTGNVTYTATWKVDSNNNGKPDDEEERYTVTYLDGANGRAFAGQVYTGLKLGDTTPKFNGTPVRSGYVFIGWSPVWSGTVTGNVTYTATWSTITGGLDKVPKTGDSGLTLALSALLLFSFCGAAACVVSTKKRG